MAVLSTGESGVSIDFLVEGQVFDTQGTQSGIATATFDTAEPPVLQDALPGEITFRAIAQDIPGSNRVTALVMEVDLDVDSDNNDGIRNPDQDDTEDQIEDDPDKPGKFVTVNHNDDDQDEIPDYADLHVPGEGNLISLVLKINPQLDWEKVWITFSYAGEFTLPDFTPNNLDSGFKDYLTPIKKDKSPLRVWNLPPPAEIRVPSLYIQPDRAYSADELGFTGLGVFSLEGVNPEKIPITVTMAFEDAQCKDTVMVTIVAPNIGVNNSNPPGDEDLRTGIADVEFLIDEDDETVEDQGEGFRFWWAKDQRRQISRSGIVDIAPLMIDIPPVLREERFKFYLELKGATSRHGPFVYVYPAVSPSDNRRAYLQTDEKGEAQRQQVKNNILLENEMPVRIPDLKDDENEFVFKGRLSIARGDRLLTLSLLIEEPDTGNQIVADTVKLSMRDSASYWSLYSTRGSNTIHFEYPTEDGRTVTIQRFPDGEAIFDHRDTFKKKHAVFIHGYNNSLKTAQRNNDELFKRLFWLGFRGNYLGLAWRGDEGLAGTGFFSFAHFDTNVENAFKTAPAALNFLKTIRGFAGGAQNVDVISHSLGNLVMWDALRLRQREGDRSPLIRNAISIESATWPENYLSEASITYNAPGDDPIIYTTQQLKQHAWAFWFNQQGFEARNSVDAVYHSFVPDDAALEFAMRLNDFLQRGKLGAKLFHYHRDTLERDPIEFRSPAPVARNNFFNVIPTLMLPGHRKPKYKRVDLNLPVGTQDNPLAVNYNALTDGNWRTTKHSDFLAVGKDNTGVMWFPVIYEWYEEFLGENNIDETPRIPLGKE